MIRRVWYQAVVEHGVDDFRSNAAKTVFNK
jgi:hypothetical protein